MTSVICCISLTLFPNLFIAWLIQYSLVLCSGIYLKCNDVISKLSIMKCVCSVWMCGVFILWNLLEDMAQLQLWPCSLAYCSGVKAICMGAESVLQNCVMGRCANLHIHILLHLPFYNEKVGDTVLLNLEYWWWFFT